MAIFIASTKSISRGSGQSAVASASYRAGVELEDKRYGKTHDYSKRHGVMSSEIVLPSALSKTNCIIDRGILWNKAEAAEKRKDARVAREWLVNLPYELPENQRREIALQFTQALTDRYGVVADCAIHKPTQKEIERGADPRNFHAHIMLTTRKIEISADNSFMLTNKSTTELSDKKRRELGLDRMSVEVKEVRLLWEQLANNKLAEYDINLIDSRSYREQGIDLLPQIKMGVDATHLERRTGVKSDKGAINDLINERNELVWESELADNNDINSKAIRTITQRRRQERLKQRLKNRTQHINERFRNRTKKATSYVERTATATDSTSQCIRNTEQRIEKTVKAISKLSSRVDRTRQRTENTEQRATETKRTSSNIVKEIKRTDNAINKAIGASPSPFDEQYTASTHRRKQQTEQLAEQQKRVTEQTEQFDRRVKQENYEDQTITQTIASKRLALAYRIICINDSKNHFENPYGKKAPEEVQFDERQRQVISKAITSLDLKRPTDMNYQEYCQKVSEQIDLPLVENNTRLIKLLKSPIADRSCYAKTIEHYNNFLSELDKDREASNIKVRSQIGGRTEITRMVSETITVPNYIDDLDNYIRNDSTPAECKELALKHRLDTLNRTIKQFELSIKDLHLLPVTNRDLVRTAVYSSLKSFSSKSSIDLSKEQIEAIQDIVEVPNTTKDDYSSSKLRFR